MALGARAHFIALDFDNVVTTQGELMPIADQVRWRAVARISSASASRFGGDPRRLLRLRAFLRWTSGGRGPDHGMGFVISACRPISSAPGAVVLRHVRPDAGAAVRPSNCWGTTPSRYDQMGRFYRKYVKAKNELVFDCNVVASHEKGFGGFPSEKPAGEEIRQIAYNMNLSNSRPTFYSEDAIFPNDFWNMSSVLAHDTKITEVSGNCWKVTSPNTVLICAGDKEIQVKLDGKPWFARDEGEIIVPSGDHNLEFSNASTNLNNPYLLMITGELLSAKFSSGSFELNYFDDIAPCYITVDKKPSGVNIDNAACSPAIYSDSQDRFTLKLPRGKHVVKILF